MLSVIITLVGLLVLEIVQSVDNAIVNAHMLKTMSERARKWFLLWGILTAVFLVRGLLPLPALSGIRRIGVGRDSVSDGVSGSW